MAANTDPVFPCSPRSFTKTLPPGVVSNTSDNQPTGVMSLGVISNAGGQGAYCRVTPLATNTAAVLAFYKRKAAEPTGTWHLIATRYLPATTVSVTAPPTPFDVPQIAGQDFEAGDEIGVGSWSSLSANADVDLGWYDLAKVS